MPLWNLRENLRYLLALHLEGQRSFAKQSAQVEQGTRPSGPGTLRGDQSTPRILGLRRKRRHSYGHRSSMSHFRPGAWTDVNPVRPMELAQLVCIRVLAICR